MSHQEEIALLQSNIQTLLNQYADLKKQVGILEEANKNQRETLLQTSAELVELRKKYALLETAHAMTAVTEDKERAKRHMSALITKIDKAIELISAEALDSALVEN